MKLSIITITYNAQAFLERTIKSILAQTEQAFEYIIIDGASKDGTLAIAQQYKARINQLISEPDNGLYHAMNKGLQLAKGEYVWFMNAGDEIADSQAVANIYKQITATTDVFYGDTFFVKENGEILGLRSQITPHQIPKKLKWQDMKLGMVVCHQSFIARKSNTSTYLQNNLSADIDWEIECLKKAKEIKYLNFPLSKYLVGGVSNQQLKRSLTDRYTVIQKHFGFWGAIIAHLKILWRGVLFMISKKGKYW